VTAPVVDSSHRRAATDWANVTLIATAGVVAWIILFISSGPNGAAGLGWFALPILGLLSACLWLGVGIHSIVHRRLPLGLIVAPLIGVLTVALVYSFSMSRIRFILLDRPAFAAIIAQVPAPVVNLPDRDLTEDESYQTFDDFPGPCPPVIGTLIIRDCATFAAGYLFYDEAGSGLVDDGGIAYMPAGIPSHDVGNGSFESPDFVHLTGPWYSFASSW
jgi:hypothetical protein